MKPSFLEVKAVVDTLPIGFYANRRINTSLKEGIECSSYDPKLDIIEISYDQIIMGMDSVTDQKEIETLIRSNYYHEVSHAILTPKDMHPTDIVNIFEDERLETLLADYYYGVDFKDSVMKINGFDPEHPTEPTNPLEAFYQLVRFRRGSKELLKEVDRIIERFKGLTRNSTFYGGIGDYVDEIENLYRKFDSSYTSDPEETMGKGKGEPMGNDGEEAKGTSGTPIGTDPAKGALDRDTITAMFEGVVNDPSLFDPKFHNATLQLFESFRKKNSKGSALRGYSGVLNPRLADSPSYKMFERSTTARGNNQFGSFHLNLFIDTSGSFRGADDEVNKLIKSLIIIESSNPNFSFDVVTMSEGEELRPKDNRYIRAGGGNHLSKKIFELYRKVQLPQTYNYNIVLFDGDAYSNDVSWSRVERIKDGLGFSAFANNNCTIISDGQNERYIKQYAPHTRTVITRNFVRELADNVLMALQRALN